MKCPYCGGTNSQNAVFCSHCGKRLPIQSHQPDSAQTSDWGGNASAPRKNTNALIIGMVLVIGVLLGVVLMRGKPAEQEAQPPVNNPVVQQPAATQEAPRDPDPSQGIAEVPQTSAPDKSDSLEEKQKEAAELAKTFSAGPYHSLWIRSDGTVAYRGSTDDGRDKVSGWRDIVMVCAASHSVGLRSDGTVYAAGKGDRCNVSGWTDIVKIDGSDNSTVGLTSSGRVVAVGKTDLGMIDVNGWRDMVDVAAGEKNTYGLCVDGTVRAVGSDAQGQKTDVGSWRNVVSISAGTSFVAGLKSDGTVVWAGSNAYKKDDADFWTDIIAISAGSDHLVGLRSDGTVEATGRNDKDQCNVSGWTDIVAISAGQSHTIGLRSDGTFVVAGLDAYGPG